MRRFLRKKCSAALPVDNHSRTISVEKYGREFSNTCNYRLDFTPPNVTELRGHLFFGRLIYRILSETDRNVGKGKDCIYVLALRGDLQCLITPKSLNNCGWKFVCARK